MYIVYEIAADKWEHNPSFNLNLNLKHKMRIIVLMKVGLVAYTLCIKSKNGMS